jgi:hypothetical protein
MVSHMSKWIVALTCAAALGCSTAAERKAREDAKRADIAAEYTRLGFMIPLLDQTSRTTIACDDDTLPQHLRRDARSCKRLALADEEHVRHLFGSGPPASDDWRWMRTEGFRNLLPRDEIRDLGLSAQAGYLERLARTNVGVFTRNEAPPAEARQLYRGWLVIIDTVEKKVRCQVAINADIARVFDRGRGPDPVSGFKLDVDKQLKPITKNFCAD